MVYYLHFHLMFPIILIFHFNSLKKMFLYLLKTKIISNDISRSQYYLFIYFIFATFHASNNELVHLCECSMKKKTVQ